MFTGIITDLGRVRKIVGGGRDTRFEIATAYDTRGLDIGASVAHNGCCLTVIEKGHDEAGGWFAVHAAAETLAITTLGTWVEGQAINLERALKVGDELGGHIVSGHVDAMARVVAASADGDSWRFTLEVPPEFAKYVAAKGSVVLNGVSLTVNEVDDNRFGVCIIPHTLIATTFGTLKVGDMMNFEIDVVARYVARLREYA